MYEFVTAPLRSHAENERHDLPTRLLDVQNEGARVRIYEYRAPGRRDIVGSPSKDIDVHIIHETEDAPHVSSADAKLRRSDIF